MSLKAAKWGEGHTAMYTRLNQRMGKSNVFSPFEDLKFLSSFGEPIKGSEQCCGSGMCIPDSAKRFPDPDLDFLLIPDLGSRGQKGTGSRICNTISEITLGYERKRK